MSKNIFISREIGASSPIQTAVDRYGGMLQAMSLLQFEDVPFELPTTEWLFFYSKTGVRYFFNSELVRSSHKEFKVACYGPATAQYCTQYHEVNYSGNINPVNVAQDVEQFAGQSGITFICGKHSLRSVQKELTKYDLSELIVYNHFPKSNVKLGKYDIAILTSPLNVQSFFSNDGLADQFIVIGQTTENAMKQYGVRSVVADQPNEAGLATALKKYLTLN